MAWSGATAVTSTACNYIVVSTAVTSAGTIFGARALEYPPRREVTRVEIDPGSAAKARALLLSGLSDDQRREFEESQRFTVVGSKGRRYRVVPEGFNIGEREVGNVHEIDERGEVVARLCAHPYGVPRDDMLLAQKLALESDEDAFRRVANVHFRRAA